MRLRQFQRFEGSNEARTATLNSEDPYNLFVMRENVHQAASEPPAHIRTLSVTTLFAKQTVTNIK